MYLKNRLHILLCFFLPLSLFYSCLGDDDWTDENITYSDAEILTFSLSHDSIDALANVVFSIDQRNGLIYNYDSMAYNTDIYEKVIVKYTSGAGTSNALNVTDGDSVWVASGDSLDVTKPLTFRTYALNGITQKYYTIKLNIHQVDPDSVQYHRIASGLAFLETEETKSILFNNVFYAYSKLNDEIQLYTSKDAITWTKGNLTGLPENVVLKELRGYSDVVIAFTDEGGIYQSSNATDWQTISADYPVISILGYLKPTATQTGGFSFVVEKDGNHVFAYSPDLESWTYGQVIPESFPIKDFSTISYELVKTSRITNIGGASSDGNVKNSVWSTQNGLYWAKIDDEKFNIIPPMEGANAFYYNDELWVMNGKLKDGTYNEKVYYSINGGTEWLEKPEKCETPNGYEKRYGASFMMDSQSKYFYVIGGSHSGLLTDIWMGYLNKMEYKN